MLPSRGLALAALANQRLSSFVWRTSAFAASAIPTTVCPPPTPTPRPHRRGEAPSLRRFSAYLDGRGGGGDAVGGGVASANDPSESSAAASGAWRRSQLSKITDKFSDPGEAGGDGEPGGDGEGRGANPVVPPAAAGSVNGGDVEDDNDAPPKIVSDEDLQQMWRDMESRVLHRRTLTAEQRGGRFGRRNVRRTDEDVWLEAGLYDDSGGADGTGGDTGMDDGSGEKDGK